MTEEIFQYCQERFGNTTLGKEQKTAGIPRNPELEKRRNRTNSEMVWKKTTVPKTIKRS